ncbi:hypothetical protein [Pseudomonas chlororaphis]|uniref:hypothetical protein n=1 Tax=Pseudomonas chlororaphis TaxID=587753 RepID=UPI001B3170AC|nr:hypothetical protein [Pseudomonas chlororaphis]QTT88451.1 hypothetical protein HUT28_14060 [Pseudomonas chlororaphis]
MVATKSFEWFFGSVCVVNKSKVFLVGQNEDLLDQDPDEGMISFVFRWDGSWSSKPVPIMAISACHITTPEPTALFLGQNGVIIRLSPTVTFVPEIMDDSEEGPQHIGDMREIRTIAGQAYACGMGRTVYRNSAGVIWERLDHGTRLPLGDESDSGFNSIDGFNSRDIYAVGWDGEIWHRDSQAWSQCDSPTNLALFRVVCSSFGEVFICGQRGLILHGLKSSWLEMQLPDSTDDVTGAIEFQGKLYFCTKDALYRLDGDSIVRVDVSENNKKITTRPAESFGALDANKEVIWSVGAKMTIYSLDGKNWTETTY